MNAPNYNGTEYAPRLEIEVRQNPYERERFEWAVLSVNYHGFRQRTDMINPGPSDGEWVELDAPLRAILHHGAAHTYLQAVRDAGSQLAETARQMRLDDQTKVKAA